MDSDVPVAPEKLNELASGNVRLLRSPQQCCDGTANLLDIASSRIQALINIASESESQTEGKIMNKIGLAQKSRVTTIVFTELCTAERTEHVVRIALGEAAKDPMDRRDKEDRGWFKNITAGELSGAISSAGY